MDLDVKRIMLKLLETQKEYALADLENYSEAMVAVFTADGKSYVTFPKFSGEVAKIAEYTAIVERARESGAVLLITVNAGWTKVVKAASELGDYRWGELGPHNSQRCIVLTASGPGLQSCSLELGYAIKERGVEFDAEPEFLYGIELNLLPDWPGRQPHGSS
ncbi:MAG: hypothetical protein ABR971_08240 [Acidobacteriaceae bacterium]|jgi:hypothetical protein